MGPGRCTGIYTAYWLLEKQCIKKQCSQGKEKDHCGDLLDFVGFILSGSHWEETDQHLFREQGLLRRKYPNAAPKSVLM